MEEKPVKIKVDARDIYMVTDVDNHATPENMNTPPMPDEKEEVHTWWAEYLRSWDADEWHYIGVMAEAEILVPAPDGVVLDLETGRSYTREKVRSAGLWGIESNHDDYVQEIFEEEKAQLIDTLREMGIEVLA